MARCGTPRGERKKKKGNEMCGIMAGPKRALQATGGITQHLNTIKHRGVHAYGFIAITNGVPVWYRSLSKKKMVAQFKRLPEDAYVIVHNRWASIGKADDVALSHPQVINSKGNIDKTVTKVPQKVQNLAIIHNGTNNDAFLTHPFAQSDTQALALGIENAKDRLKYIQSIGLEGTGVVFMVDKNGDVNIYKDHLRPLVYNREHNVLASEPLYADNWIEVADTDASLQPLNNLSFAGTVLDVGKLGKPVKCATCKKVHIHEVGRPQCAICEIREEMFVEEVKTAKSAKGNGLIIHVANHPSDPAVADLLKYTGNVYLHECGLRVTETGVLWADFDAKDTETMVLYEVVLLVAPDDLLGVPADISYFGGYYEQPGDVKWVDPHDPWSWTGWALDFTQIPITGEQVELLLPE